MGLWFKKKKFETFSVFVLIFCLFLFSTQLHVINVTTPSLGECKKVPIVMYHGIRDKESRNRYIICRNLFKEDLEYMKNNGYTTIFCQDLIDYVEGKKDLPEKPIIITFDDGFYNNYKYAFPLLKEYNQKMVLSPIGIEVDKYSEDFPDPERFDKVYCSWSHLKEMSDSKLVEIQNHSYNMHKIKRRYGIKKKKKESAQEYKKNLIKDSKKAQEKIKEKLGIVPRVFTYPLGAFSPSSEEILKEIGFKAFLTCSGKVNVLVKGNNKSLCNLGRFIRTPRYSSENFFKKNIEKE